MSLKKTTHIDGETVIYAKNLNDIQDVLLTGAVSALSYSNNVLTVTANDGTTKYTVSLGNPITNLTINNGTLTISLANGTTKTLDIGSTAFVGASYLNNVLTLTAADGDKSTVSLGNPITGVSRNKNVLTLTKADGTTTTVNLANGITGLTYANGTLTATYTDGTTGNVLTVDSSPTASSSNPVTSGGVKTAFNTLVTDLKAGTEATADYHLGFYLDENGDLCQAEE